MFYLALDEGHSSVESKGDVSLSVINLDSLKTNFAASYSQTIKSKTFYTPRPVYFRAP